MNDVKSWIAGVSSGSRTAVVPLVALAAVFLYVLAHAFDDGLPAGFQSMNENELAEISGQSLFVADHIGPEELTGAPADGSADFDFYRMGMDVELAMNMNISKLQLGCGGVNENILSDACDIDLDFVRFMGRDGSQPDPDGPQSDFTLTRPLIEIAVDNDGSPTNRSVAGIKIGAERADGYVGVGRRYFDNVENQENPGEFCDPGATEGDGVLACHSGANTISGFLGAEMSAEFTVNCDEGFTCSLGFNPSADACVGYVSGNSIDGCGPGIEDRLFIDVDGTRMEEMFLRYAKLGVEGGFLVDLLSGGEGFAQLLAGLRNLHGFSMEDTGDFFLSMQRERVAWPRFDKETPPDGDTTACNAAFGGERPDRCFSAYAVPANTGWWMNVPEARVLDIQGDDQSGDADFLTDSLSPPGAFIENPELDMVPPDNCYGSAEFC